MRYIRVVNDKIAGRPIEDPRAPDDVRRAGLVPLESAGQSVPLACADCFDSLFFAIDYDKLNGTAKERLLSVPEIKSRFAEWLIGVMSARQIAQTILVGETEWQVQLRLSIYHDLLTGILTETDTVVLALSLSDKQHDLLTLSSAQAKALIVGYRTSYAKAANVVSGIQSAVREAETMDDLMELTATLDSDLPWVSFTKDL